MKKFSLGCLGALLLVVLIFSLFLNAVLVTSSAGEAALSVNNMQRNPFDEQVIAGSIGSDGRVAVIELFGVIGYSQPGDLYQNMVDEIIKKIKLVESDNATKAVIVRIDSPGGEVTASDVIYHHLAELDKIKPVIVYMDSVAASGGYYSAIAGRYLMANELTITGSIGVVLQSVNLEKLGDKIGISAVTIKSGKLKDLLNPFRPVTEEEETLLQNLIDESYSRFVGLVAQEREIDEEKLRSTIADGRILSGRQALESGLIDETGYFEDAIEKATELGGIDADSEVYIMNAPVSFGRVLKLLGSRASQTKDTKLRLELGGEGIPLKPGVLYYLTPTFISPM
ncbi:MAG: signal peptide peptidase SppA [Verrucomicrobiota bacterium]